MVFFQFALAHGYLHVETVTAEIAGVYHSISNLLYHVFLQVASVSVFCYYSPRNVAQRSSQHIVRRDS